jgi:RNA polymerase sigma factor (TIGR02999 family)
MMTDEPGGKDAAEPTNDLANPVGADRWAPILYRELRRIAHRERWRVSGGDTLNTTALVHEAYGRLAEAHDVGGRSRFLATAAVTIRHILVDRVRAQLAAKRGGGLQDLPLEAADDFVVEDDEAVLTVHEALESLAKLSPRLAQVVECRFFAGYTEAETAEALGISEATVHRDWTTARAWLKRELQN